MDVDTFWRLIEASRLQTNDCQRQGVVLSEMLAVYGLEDIVAFQELMAERTADLYRWDVWAVADIMNGGASDDGFDYFRQWIIAQGRDAFEMVLQDPERAAELVPVGTEHDHTSRECESMLSTAAWAYEEKAGEEIPISEKPLTMIDQQPQGQPWDDEDLEHLYPRLYMRFILR